MLRAHLVLSSLLLFAVPSFAQTTPKVLTKTATPTTVPEVVEVPATDDSPAVVAPREPEVQIQQGSTQGPLMLHPWGVHGTVTLGYLAPFKYGLGFTYAKSPTWVWNLSYIKGGLGFGIAGIDFGGFDESLLSLGGRYYPWAGSFNWIFAASRHAYRVHLGNDMVARMSGGPGSVDLLKVETLGIQIGVGNRIQFKNNLWLAIDWLTINIPVVTLKTESPALDAYMSANDRRLVGDALSLMENLTTASFLKTSLGYSF